MTDPTAAGREYGIGELARLVGVPVRTVRFYCDEGLLEARRSAGGHRRFDASSVERLRLVRRLRGLGLGLPAITTVLLGERSLAEAVAAERATLDVELAAMAWRRASLRAVEEATPAQRAERLDLLAAVTDGAAAREALVGFWRRQAVAPLPAEIFDAFVAMSVPPPPPDPSPEQVVAYAEMVALVADRSLTRLLQSRARANLAAISDERTLLIGVGEACELAAPLVHAGRRPGPGAELDRFVAAHAAGRGVRDTRRFRRALMPAVAVDRDLRIERYWRLVGEVTGEVATVGATHSWLIEALDRSVGPDVAHTGQRAPGPGPA